MVQLFAVVPNALHELLVNAQKISYQILSKGVGYADREVVQMVFQLLPIIIFIRHSSVQIACIHDLYYSTENSTEAIRTLE